jgi:hypothetical protein
VLRSTSVSLCRFELLAKSVFHIDGGVNLFAGAPILEVTFRDFIDARQVVEMIFSSPVGEQPSALMPILEILRKCGIVVIKIWRRENVDEPSVCGERQLGIYSQCRLMLQRCQCCFDCV